MNIQRILIISIAVFFVVAGLAGCGGSSSDVGGGDIIGGPQPAPATATLVVQHQLLRAVPNTINEFRFTGFGSSSSVVFGPQTVATSAEVTLILPVTVTRLRIEYLSQGIVMGTFDQNVQLASGQTVTINDPAWVDVVLRNGLAVEPTGASLGVGQTQQFNAFVVAQDGTRSATTATWTSSNNTVVSVSNTGLVTGISAGSATVTASADAEQASAIVTVTANAAPSQPLSSGTLGQAIPYPAPGGPTGLQLGDLDRDGDLDAAVANQLSDNFAVYINDGGGNFSPGDVTAGGKGNNYVRLGDFDRNGTLDAAVVAGEEDQVQLFLNSGDPLTQTSAFSFGPTLLTGKTPFCMDVADLNGDGDLDIVVANSAGNNPTATNVPGNSLTRYLGGEGASFGSRVDTTTQNRPLDVDLADITTDGAIDAIVAQNDGSTIGVFTGDSGGNFTPATNIYRADFPGRQVVADFNGDVLLDVAVGKTRNGGGIQVLFNQGGGALSNPVAFGAAISRGIGAADLDGDGDIDLVTSGDRAVAVYLNDGSGGFGPASIIAIAELGGALADLAIGDVTGDGIPDVVVVDVNLNTLFVLPGQP